MTKAGLLYVEDDKDLAFVTKDLLEREGFGVTHCTSGKKALTIIQTKDFDLCILDVMLPELDGFSVAEEIRKMDNNIPIIFLTAKSLKDDKLKGLRIGGDDYITKPFSIEELILKIEIFLKRPKIKDDRPAEVRIGIYSFNHQLQSLISPVSNKKLTKREADLLNYFSLHRNQIIKRSNILERIWGEDDYFLGRSLDVFISRLRRYLKEDSSIKIENIHGVGFQLKC